MSTEAETRPAIPASLADRPVRGGLALPWVNVELADGGADFRTTHHARFEEAWKRCLCQSCGRPARPRAVLVCGPRQILHGKFDEPPVCPPCALYASRACPMVGGRTETYPARPRVAEGHRGATCPDPGCGCDGWRESDPEHSADQGGQPALPWYACWITPGAYQLTGHKALILCSDLGCEHERVMINGATLTAPPGRPGGHDEGVRSARAPWPQSVACGSPGRRSGARARGSAPPPGRCQPGASLHREHARSRQRGCRTRLAGGTCPAGSCGPGRGESRCP